ncbi:hypothetical protein [Hymenobacter siberiensis]|uniref:hypothetical protein n=1 Tax=Hymenobacter siberiensis TaxID=2848396 RepID=UPI001C1E02E4|nr:hypothetical protein [Hymenobacter siberiensis]
MVCYPGRLVARLLFGFLWLLLFGAALLFSAGCSKQQTLQALFRKSTPHQAYARQLHQAGLDQRPAGRAWLTAAAQALRDSLVVALPFAETGYFRPERPAAASYRYAVQAGGQVHVSLALAPGTNARVFLDAFEMVPGRTPPPWPMPIRSPSTSATGPKPLASTCCGCSPNC